jgi:hypothetical protein
MFSPNNQGLNKITSASRCTFIKTGLTLIMNMVIVKNKLFIVTGTHISI